jgi:hypothetical protein
MATAQQPPSSKAAILGDFVLPFAGLGEELVGIVAQGLRLGAFFGPAGFHGLAGGIGALLFGHLLGAGLPAFTSEIGKMLS